MDSETALKELNELEKFSTELQYEDYKADVEERKSKNDYCKEYWELSKKYNTLLTELAMPAIEKELEAEAEAKWEK